MLVYLAFAEKVWQVFHGIRSNACDVIVLTGVLSTQRLYAILNVIAHFDSYLHTKTHLVREHFTQHDKQAAVTTTNVGKFHLIVLVCHIVVVVPLHQVRTDWTISVGLHFKDEFNASAECMEFKVQTSRMSGR